METKLPIYQLLIDDSDSDNTKVNYVALVDMPAIESNWIAFAEQSKAKQFEFDVEKQIISGPLMIPNKLIYRNDANGEYYCLFSAEEIFKIVKKFHRNQYGNNVNIMHNAKQKVDGVYMIENFIIDSKRGINAPYGMDLPDGTWFGTYKVDNAAVWADIKEGKFKGFSVEGMFYELFNGAARLSVIEQLEKILNCN